MSEQGNKGVNRPHAFICYRRHLKNLIQAGDTFGFVCKEQEPECWNHTELIQDEQAILNISIESQSYGDGGQRVFTIDGHKVDLCYVMVDITFNLDVYALVCNANAFDVTMLVQSKIMPALYTDLQVNSEFFRKLSMSTGVTVHNEDYDDERAMTRLRAQAEVVFIPSRPNMMIRGRNIVI